MLKLTKILFVSETQKAIQKRFYSHAKKIYAVHITSQHITAQHCTAQHRITLPMRAMREFSRGNCNIYLRRIETGGSDRESMPSRSDGFIGITVALI